ncbi:gas vesicle protein GvpO [Actinacidiphila rubida]|uniref:Gas vesicle synthesis protein GvpO n=1 Tax=Actinacidiphila rubida TaxID=310780 RepID=A0A1H8TIJ1_9ACTN|nr:gas vesicle protein [Actinacidiphila rubida]SEO90930.1 Gas vesicle synthesis protein GvpO [Actinacidiphila rubida]
MAEQRPARSRPANRRPASRSHRVSSAADAAESAADSLAGLIRHPVDGASSVARTDDDGWRVGVDVVEVPRIPDTTSLMATYEVELGPDGTVRSYHRTRRYRRSEADD